MIAHAWLQKHASPTASGGEFHWHPAELAQPALIERLHGAPPPCVLWELAPGRVVWAQPFAAIAPGDGRRYIGLVATIAERAGATPAELLAELRIRAARPWSDIGDIKSHGGGAHELSAGALAGDARELLGDGIAIAGALLDGGDALLADPSHAELPRAIAELEALAERAPGIAARTRFGAWRSTACAPANASPAAAWLAAAWRDGRTANHGDANHGDANHGDANHGDADHGDADHGAADDADASRAYRAACELAAARGASIHDVATDGGVASALTADERAALGEPLDWPRVANAWGRDRLADGAAVRLADALAMRVISDLASGRDPRRAIAAVRWHALLPAARRRELFALLARRAASLEELIDA